MHSLKVDLKPVISELKKRKAEKIIVQMPEGLKTNLYEISKKLEEKTGVKTITLIDPCFGACDLPVDELEKFNADLILHFGHNKFFNYEKVIYVPLEYDVPEKLLENTFKKLEKILKEKKIKKIGIASIVQYKTARDFLKKLLEKKGFIVLMEKGLRTEEGQVLGCSGSAIAKVSDKVDAAVFVGDGNFHAEAVNFSTKKPVFVADVLNEKILKMKNRDRFLRQRHSLIAKASESESFGIIISTKIGQMRYGEALKLKKLVEKNGKKAIILTADLILPEFLLGIKADCFVSTACPRIAIDDWKNFKKPIINPEELEIALGEKLWKNFSFKDY